MRTWLEIVDVIPTTHNLLFAFYQNGMYILVARNRMTDEMVVWDLFPNVENWSTSAIVNGYYCDDGLDIVDEMSRRLVVGAYKTILSSDRPANRWN
jgi:hypothetical protein